MASPGGSEGLATPAGRRPEADRRDEIAGQDLGNQGERQTHHELLERLAVDIKDLGLSELAIAKLEMKEEMSKLKYALAVAAGSGVIALVGLIVLAFAAAQFVVASMRCRHTSMWPTTAR